MTATNRQYVLSSRPAHLAGPDNFDLRHAAVPDPAEGEALVAIEMVALSAWQGMRAKEFRNFIRPFDIGELISCDAYGTVVQSRCQALPHGTAVVGRLGWQDYALVTPDRVDVAGPDHSAEEWLTALSSPGQTPYLAFSRKARPMPGETLVVTSAAGAVGSYAVQLGKLAGMRVVGIVGSADKADFVTGALGADAAVSYKAPDFAAQLEAACPDGVDLFFDTVGGGTADTVLGCLARNAHVLLVGRVAANNSPDPESDPANMRHVWSQEATIHAFSRYSYKDLYPYVIDRLGRLLRAEKLTMHNHVVDGFKQTPGTLNAMLAGRFLGKVLVRYADAGGTRL